MGFYHHALGSGLSSRPRIFWQNLKVGIASKHFPHNFC
jgi:hypothetical protein